MTPSLSDAEVKILALYVASVAILDLDPWWEDYRRCPSTTAAVVCDAVHTTAAVICAHTMRVVADMIDMDVDDVIAAAINGEVTQ